VFWVGFIIRFGCRWRFGLHPFFGGDRPLTEARSLSQDRKNMGLAKSRYLH
jgi:hypothetical protein